MHHLRSRDPGGLSSSEKWSRYLNIRPNIHALLPPSIPWMVSQSQAQICSPPLWRSASGMPFPLSAFLDVVHVSKPSKPKSTFSPVSFVRITAVKLQMLLQSWGWKFSTTMVRGYLCNHNMAKRNLLVGVRKRKTQAFTVSQASLNHYCEASIIQYHWLTLLETWGMSWRIWRDSVWRNISDLLTYVCQPFTQLCLQSIKWRGL